MLRAFWIILLGVSVDDVAAVVFVVDGGGDVVGNIDELLDALAFAFPTCCSPSINRSDLILVSNLEISWEREIQWARVGCRDSSML